MNMTKRYPLFVLVTVLAVCATLVYAQTGTLQKSVTPVAGVVKFQFATVNATISSIQFPAGVVSKMKGTKETGQLTAIAAPLAKGGTARVSTLNLRTGKGTVVWSVKLTGPMLDKLFQQGLMKQKEIILDFVGNASLDPKTGKMLSVDVARIPTDVCPALGLIDVENENWIELDRPVPVKPAEQAKLSFRPLQTGQVSEAQFRTMTEEAFRANGVTLPSQIINGFVQQRQKTPTQELHLYFHQTGTFASATLTGSAVMEIVP